MKKIDYLTILGFLSLLVVLVLNPFFLEQFSPDKQLDPINLIVIIIFDLFFLVGSILAIWLKKNLILNILLLILVTSLVIVITEATFYFLDSNNDIIDFFERVTFGSETNLPLIEKEGVGLMYSPNTVNNHNLYVDGTLIFSVNYTIDEFSRRITKENQSNSHLLLFGGSLIFGHGLEDNQTLPYFLSELTDYRVYNYAQDGWGTQQMLAHLEHEDFTKEVPSKDGVAIYAFTPHHIRRVIGDMYVVNYWGESFPYYYIDKNNKIIHQGNFVNGRPIITWIYKMLWKLNTVRYFKVNLPIENEKHIYLTYKIIEKAENVYQSKFDGTFYVLIHPYKKDDPATQDLIKLLKENDINILYYPIDYSTEDYIPGDIQEHPTAKFNEILANLIAEDLKREQKKYESD